MAQDYTKKRHPRKRRSRKGLQRSGDLIHKIARSLNFQSQLDEYYIQKYYAELFGRDISKNSFPAKLINRSLHLTVISSAWLMQLSFIKADMISKINGKLGKKSVTNIIFRVGKLPKSGIEKRPADKVYLGDIKLDDETEMVIARDTRHIKDDTIKRAVKAAQTMYYKRKSKK